MKNNITRLSLLVFCLTAMGSCTTKPSPKKEQIVSSQRIEGVLKSATGEELPYSFDNATNTMTIQYQGETITLQGQPSGSGIKYANAHFTYTEWQGNSTLQKDGLPVFEVHKETGKPKE